MGIRIFLGNPGCLAGDTKILTKRGYVKITRLKENDIVMTVSDDNKIIEAIACFVFYAGEKKAYRLRNIDDNIDILCSKEHNWFTFKNDRLNDINITKAFSENANLAFIDKSKIYNKKLIISKTYQTIPMYDLHIPLTNKFIVEGGLISKNSGKTACAVRELMLNKENRITFTNIITTKIPNYRQLTQDMIIKKEMQLNNDGEPIIKKGEPVFKKTLNVDFWKDTIEKYKSINICIDEAHIIANPRRSSSKTNLVFTDFLALVRRVLGSSDAGHGNLTLISQLDNRIDGIARDMCNHVRFHICRYSKSCKRCAYTWRESNEDPEPTFICPFCASHDILKHSHVIEVWHFDNMENYQLWRFRKMKTYYRHYLITDIEEVFGHYQTLQWDSLISDY